jgi:predicted phage terminase large subunit-like protein
MTVRDLLALERQVLEGSFKLFLRDAWPHVDPKKFKPNWHVDAMCDHLQAVHDGDINRLAVNVPPGAMKSLTTSVFYPAWVWTTKPHTQFISTSFSMRRSAKDARRMRKLVESDWFQKRWPMRMAADQNEKNNFENEYGGSRIAEPFTGMTGARGHCVIIDDPHSVDGAKSVAERTATVETFLDAIPNRLNDLDEDAIIVIMQRLHEEDVTGAILDRPDLGYEHLVIPMEFEEAREPTCIGWVDPRTKPGELMHPAHFTPTAILKLKASYTPTTYAGQYQQRPAPKEAGEIDVRWFEHSRYDIGEHPKGCNFYMTSDHAPSGNADYNVFRIWAVDHKRHLWLVDSFHKRCKMQEALGIERDGEGKLKVMPTGALRLIQKWKPLGFFPEDDNNWKSVGDMFQQALRECGIFVRIDPQPTSGLGDKVVKVQSYCALASLGQVHLPRGPIGEDALREYALFPAGKHDDLVDADGMIGRVQTKLRPGYLPMTDRELMQSKNDYSRTDRERMTDADSFFI